MEYNACGFERHLDLRGCLCVPPGKSGHVFFIDLVAVEIPEGSLEQHLDAHGQSTYIRVEAIEAEDRDIAPFGLECFARIQGIVGVAHVFLVA